MKCALMSHQLDAVKLLIQNEEFYAIAADQGTGKTVMLLADAERQFLEKKITGLLVVAPKGVHTNWISREAPKHLECEWAGAVYSSGMNQRGIEKARSLNRTSGKLAILAINIDSINTPKGFAAAAQFLEAHKAMMVIDESQRIKNHKAKRTERAIELGKRAKSRRIASGTMVTEGPQDLFSQFEFMRPGLLGTNSFRAFFAEYADLLPNDHPLVIAASRGARWSPQIVRKDFKGRPVYRNLDKLTRIIAPYRYRITKEQCLDLPPKVYKTISFELTPTHRRAYNAVRDNLRFEYGDGELDTFSELTVINKLRQAASGFIMADGGKHTLAEGDTRMKQLIEVLEDTEGQVIIWASYVDEILSVVSMLSDQGESVAAYYGATSTKEREQIIDDFQAGNLRFIVANPAAGGTGITLTNAETVIYYSNSPSLEHRLQSEDRSHRIGTKHSVLYIDLVAEDTVDERISAALQRKNFVAKEIIDESF